MRLCFTVSENNIRLINSVPNSVFCVESDILLHAPLLLFIKVLVIHSFNVALLLSMNFVLLCCISEHTYLTESVLNIFGGIDLNSFA